MSLYAIPQRRGRIPYLPPGMIYAGPEYAAPVRALPARAPPKAAPRRPPAPPPKPAPRRVERTPPPVPPRRKAAPSQVDAVSVIWKSIVTAFNRPQVLFTVVLCVAFVVTYDATGGWFKKLKDKGYAPKLVDFITNETKRFLGALVFLPALVDLPSQFRLGVGVLVAAWVFIVPEAGPYEYAIQALLLHTYISVHRKDVRIVCIGLGALAYFSGYLVLKA